jgi:Ketosteroid isomerase-related protein
MDRPNDIGEVAAAALVNGVGIREAVYLTGPEALTLDQLAERISAHAGGPIEAVEEPIPAAEARMRADGLDEEFITYITRISQTIVAGDVARTNDEVERLTGRAPGRIDAFLAANATQLAASGGIGPSPGLEDAPKLARDNEALFRRVVAAWSCNEIDNLLGCYADDLVYTDMPLPDQPVSGKAAFRAHMEAYNGLFAGGQVEVDIVATVTSSTHVAGELFNRAKYIGPGAPAGGVPVSWYATLVVTIVGGKVVAEHAYYDPTTFEKAVAQAIV